MGDIAFQNFDLALEFRMSAGKFFGAPAKENTRFRPRIIYRQGGGIRCGASAGREAPAVF
jgi:hypothetical protein